MRTVLAAIGLAVLAAPALAADIAGVASVIDGDTIEIHGQRIRLYGIDAPESAQQCRHDDGSPWACGRQAAFALADRIGGRTVLCDARDTDRYGRIVAVCSAGGTDLGARLVERGHALAYRRYATDYVEQERAARDTRAGLWQGAFVEPWAWRRGERLSAAPGGADRDCRDLATWDEAQAFYESAGPGDPHRLDADRDGIACEALRR